MKWNFLHCTSSGRNAQGAWAFTFARATPNARPPTPPPQMSTLSLTSIFMVFVIISTYSICMMCSTTRNSR